MVLKLIQGPDYLELFCYVKLAGPDSEIYVIFAHNTSPLRRFLGSQDTGTSLNLESVCSTKAESPRCEVRGPQVFGVSRSCLERGGLTQF